MATQTKSQNEARLKALLAGVQQYLPSGSSLMVNGQSMTQAQIASQLGQMVSLLDAVVTAKSAAQGAVNALKAAWPAGQQFQAALVAGLKTFFGQGSPTLSKLGIPAPKTPAALTAGQKAIASAKRAATRKARGVMGKKQRASIAAPAMPGTVTLGPDGKAIDPAAPPAAVVPVATLSASSAPAAAPAAPPGGGAITGSGH